VGALRDAAGGGEHERERQLGGRLGEDVRRIADGDAARGRGEDIDIVVTDRVVRDDAKVRVAIEDVAVDLVGAVGQRADRAVKQDVKLVWRRRKVAGPDADRVIVPQVAQTRV